MTFTEREQLLIVNALYILEGQCIGEELHYELEGEFGGIPDHEEVRALMDKIKNGQEGEEK